MRVKMDLEVFECDGSDRVGVTIGGTSFGDFSLSMVEWFDRDMDNFERDDYGKYLRGFGRGIRFDGTGHTLIFPNAEDAYKFVDQCNSLFNSTKSEATLIVDLVPAMVDEYLWDKVKPLTEESPKDTSKKNQTLQGI